MEGGKKKRKQEILWKQTNYLCHQLFYQFMYTKMSHNIFILFSLTDVRHTRAFLLLNSMQFYKLEAKQINNTNENYYHTFFSVWIGFLLSICFFPFLNSVYKNSVIFVRWKKFKWIFLKPRSLISFRLSYFICLMLWAICFHRTINIMLRHMKIVRIWNRKVISI